jgi:DNA-directed RNA polymerase subunit RPC12/RpoP
MANARVFDCPSCGAKLTTDGTEAQIQCAYCGTFVKAPQELRVQPTAPAKGSNRS